MLPLGSYSGMWLETPCPAAESFHSMQVVLRISYPVTYAGFAHHAKAAASVIQVFPQTEFITAFCPQGTSQESLHG